MAPLYTVEEQSSEVAKLLPLITDRSYFPLWADPSQFLFRYWIISAKCCRLAATNAIVFKVFQTKPFQRSWHMRCAIFE